MEYKIRVGVSNRHIHLTKDVFNILFKKDSLDKLRDLHQIGEYASTEIVTIKTNKSTINNVRVIGPFRDYTQVEISKTDAYKLGLNPPIRRSGDIKDSESVTIIGPAGEIIINEGCIIANRHVHMTKEEAIKYNVVDNQKVLIRIDTEKKGIIEAFIKISDNAYYELHLDTDDANAFLLKNDDEVDLII